MATMNISLPDDMKSFIEQELIRGGYKTESDYFIDLVQAQQRFRAQEKLESFLQEGIESGPGISANFEFWQDLENGIVDRQAGTSSVRRETL